MIGWKSTLFLLCFFGFLKEFRPSEPFVTDYLLGSWKNFTVEQVNRDIFPVCTYANLATLVFIFLLTDILRYKPIIILCGISGALVYVLLIMGKTLIEMQILEVLYGLFMSSEVAYYTYIYAKVEKKHYEKVTGYTRAGHLLGKFSAGLVSQLTVSFEILDYYQLNFVTLAAIVLATIIAVFLPPVKHSIYFHRDTKKSDLRKYTSSSEKVETINSVPGKSPPLRKKLRNAYMWLWLDFLRAYSNMQVLKWSLWWALATCGYGQIVNFIQQLWVAARPPEENNYNGAIEAVYTIIGALTVSYVGYVKLNWALHGEAVLTFFSLVQGVVLLIASRNETMWVLYLCYIMFGVIYHTMVTVASFEVAKRLSSDSYALIFGINTFAALGAQSLLTFIVVTETFFSLDIKQQYFIYGWYFIFLGLVFFIFSIFTICKNKNSKIMTEDTELANDEQDHNQITTKDQVIE